MSWYYNFSMKTDHIPILSYVFIGITSLVLTYATIADTTGEVILPPPSSEGPESSTESSSLSGTIDKIKSLNPFATSATASGQEEIPVAVPASALPSLSGAIDKIKSINPFSTSGQEELPVAVPIEPSAPPLPMNKYPSSGGKKSTKHRKRKQKKTRRSSK